MLNEQQQAVFEYLFGILDKSGNDHIDKADFMKAFEGLKAQADAKRSTKIDNAARRWFVSLYVGGDENKDQQITKEEWFKWAASLPTQLAQGTAYPRINARFVDTVFDGISNDDETITAAEYTAWFQSFGLKGDAATCFKKLDAGNDGKITFKDFYQLMTVFVSGDTTQSGYALFGEIASSSDKIMEMPDMVMAKNK